MSASDMKIIPPKKLSGKAETLLVAGGDSFVSEPVDKLQLDYGGIVGDYHHGLTRKSGGREPWHKRGLEMRNERQITILSAGELEEIAEKMGIDRLEPGWIGANIVVSNIPRLSMLPPRSVILFDGGVTLRVDGYNAPCREAGKEIARALGAPAPQVDGQPDYKKSDMAFSFAKQADRLRGLVAWVEREGEIATGETFTVRIHEQWIYE